MSGNGPIKIIAIVAVILVVVIGGVAISRIGSKESVEDDISEIPSYTETTRGSYSGSLSLGSNSTTTTSYETFSSETEETTTVASTALSTHTKATQTNDTTVKNSVPTVTSLNIVSKPSKTSYYAGDKFSSSGLKVNAIYSDGTSKDVTSSVTVSMPDMYRSGSQTISVTYTENGIIKDTSFSISISTPSVTISSSEEVMYVGDYLYLSASTAPSNRTISWSSSASSVASVSSSGKVYALSEGVAAITASFQYGSVTYSETCLVMVKVEEPQSSSLDVYFYDGYYENNEYTLYLYDLEGTISSNYNIEYVEVGVIGPVYVNGTLQEIDQSQTYKYVYELETTDITLEELAELYGDGFEFDIVAGEEYLVYVYAEDSSGETDVDYYEMVFTVD